ncbi:MAG: recombinase family protein [Lachnospiraceae bacterium]|nr:recombinase family protein [Lachnospiraceae bacterium]
MRKYGYVRVSSKDQNPARQVEAMLEMGIQKEDIYVDKVSGKSFLRPAYHDLIHKLKVGDVICIKSIDRLGRNYQEILEQWRKIVKEMEANIIVIDMPLLNTASVNGDLTGTFVADLVLQILAYVAETEHSFIKSRQAEGIALARRNGVQFGRKRVEVTNMFEKMFEEWENGRISARAAAGKLHISYSTFYRRCREYEEQRNSEGI